MTVVRCPGCSDRNHDYNKEDPYSVGYIAGFHQMAAQGFIGNEQAGYVQFIAGVQQGSEDSKHVLIQKEFF